MDADCLQPNRPVFTHIRLTMKYFLLLLLLFPVSCTDHLELKQNDQRARDMLVGTWRGAGEYQDEDGRQEFWKIVRRHDGRFEVEYLLVHDGNRQYERSSGSGKWSYGNGRYYEVDKNGWKSVYKVYSVKKDWFEYNYIQHGDAVTIKEVKMAQGYQLKQPPEGYTEFVHQEAEDIQ